MKKLLRRRKIKKWKRLIEESGLFDEKYYLFTYPDVRSKDIDPIMHYLLYGADEGRNPSIYFNTNFYNDFYQDVKNSPLNPLVHFILFGEQEKRLPFPKKNNELLFESQTNESIINAIEIHYRSHIKSSKGNKIVVYTAIFGNYDYIKEPSYINENIDYICFTDNVNITSENFEIIILDNFFEDNTKNARMIKTLSHIFLKGYEYSIWIDGSTKIRGLNINEIFETHLKENSIALHLHKDRNCVFDEAAECIAQKKDQANSIRKQVQFLKNKKYPKNNGLVETAQVIRKHNKIIENFNNRWFYFINNYSKRDQLSFNYVAWEQNIKYDVLENTQWLNQYFKNYLHFEKPFKLINHSDSVALIMLVRNAVDITKISTKSILKLTRYNNYELIIADNNSDIETKMYLKQLENENTNVKIITNEKNLSFSEANNKAVKSANSKFVLLINNDIEIIDENWLQILIDEIKKDKNVGALGPILLYPNYTIQSASVKYNIKNKKEIELSTERKKYLHTQYVDAISGGCLLISRKLYNEIGGLDKRFFYGQEDIDFCLKILKIGKKIKIISHCELIHHESYTRTFNPTTLENRKKIKEKWFNKLDFLYNDSKKKPIVKNKTIKPFSEIVYNPLSYKTFHDLYMDITKNIHKINIEYDLIVGIPRSGMIPAYMLGLLKNTAVISYDEFVNNVLPSKGDRNTFSSNMNRSQLNVLFVDDSINLGSAYQRIMSTLPATYCNIKYTHNFLAVYASENAEEFNCISLLQMNLPRLFQWNYKNHGISQYSCYDIDGVLCIDPTDKENDDGDKYKHFILNAKPLYIPKYKIKALITSRLEKYRKETEIWLKNHNVRYEKLYMLDLPSKEERLKRKAHGSFKAEVYKSINEAVLFIESNSNQALEIAKITKKPVICTENDRLYSF